MVIFHSYVKLPAGNAKIAATSVPNVPKTAVPGLVIAMGPHRSESRRDGKMAAKKHRCGATWQ